MRKADFVSNLSSALAFDSKALGGLRGLAAVHVLLHHAFWYSTNRQSIYGQARPNNRQFMF